MRARAIKVPYTVRMVDMATAKLNVLMGILAYCVGQSTAIRSPPALLQGVGTEDMATAKLSVLMGILAYCVGQSTAIRQWRRKIVEFRGAEARKHAALPCFSPANIDLFIATNSLDDSLLLSWMHSDSLPSDSDKLSTSLLSILHLSDATVTVLSISLHFEHA